MYILQITGAVKFSISEYLLKNSGISHNFNGSILLHEK
jgi:hypothetical protein